MFFMHYMFLTSMSLFIYFFSFKKIRWNKIFKSRIIQTVALYGNTSFMVVIAILIFLLIGMYIYDITGVTAVPYNGNIM